MHDFPTKHWQIFAETIFSSPQFRPDNATNHPKQEDPYEDADLNTDIDSYMGIERKDTHTRLSLGIGTKAIFGGGDSAKTGIGAMLAFDVIIPFNGQENGSGLILGVRGLAHKIFPEGYQLEIIPMGGLTLHTDFLSGGETR